MTTLFFLTEIIYTHSFFKFIKNFHLVKKTYIFAGLGILTITVITGLILVSDINTNSLDVVDPLKSSNDLIKYIPELDMYVDIGKTVVVFPTFTAIAYGDGNFYDYYNGDCDEKCLTAYFQEGLEIPLHYINSKNAFTILVHNIGFSHITDIQLDTSPDILLKYDKVILLHNEYVTRNEFNAIINHPNVIYLYPNALYAEIKVDYDVGTISLIRGHNYPDPEITNGFDWKYDNTHPFEYDDECTNWEFYEINNGKMLNCYPEKIISKDKELLKTIIEL